jgi:hypothetical protein
MGLTPIRHRLRRSALSNPAWLVVCGVGMLLICAAALARFPLLATYRVQILTLEQQVAADGRLAPGLVLASLLLCALYIAGYLALSKTLRPPLSPRRRRELWLIVLLAPLLAAGLLLWIHPTTSLDLYDYLYRGHMAARYGANNFIQSPEELRELDRLYWYTAWRRAHTAYGPLWEAMSIAVARLSGTTLLPLLVGFKLLSALGWLLCALAIGLLSRPGQRLLAAYLWLWNPLVLWELVGAGHNDGWMLLFGLLAYGALGQRPTLALLLLTVGALIKYPLALLWPLLLAVALAQQPTLRARVLFGLGAGLLCAALVVLAYAPWWVGPATLEQFRDRDGLFTNSPLALLRALWLPHGEERQIEALLSQISLGLLGLGVGVASLWAWRRPRQLPMIGAGLLLWFVAACSPWVQPWYLVWPIGLLALHPRQVRPRIVLALIALSGLLVYPAYAALRPLLGWPGDGAAWQGVILALLYLPLLCIGFYRWLFPQRAAPPSWPAVRAHHSEAAP